jgi:hypothetical protein
MSSQQRPLFQVVQRRGEFVGRQVQDRTKLDVLHDGRSHGRGHVEVSQGHLELHPVPVGDPPRRLRLRRDQPSPGAVAEDVHQERLLLSGTRHEKGLRQGSQGVQAQRKGSREPDGFGGADASGTAVRFEDCESLHDKLNRPKGKSTIFSLTWPRARSGYGFCMLYIAQKLR